MFLGVSANLAAMDEMTDDERKRLGAAVREARMEQYPTKLAAYQDANVNSATWDRIEKGETVKEHTLRQVIKTLWPPAGGDWRRVPGVRFGDLGYSVIGDPASDDYHLRLERWISDLQERIELLEKHAYHDSKETRDAESDSAPSTQAGGSPASDVSVEDYTLAALDDETLVDEIEGHEEQP